MSFMRGYKMVRFGAAFDPMGEGLREFNESVTAYLADPCVPEELKEAAFLTVDSDGWIKVGSSRREDDEEMRLRVSNDLKRDADALARILGKYADHTDNLVEDLVAVAKMLRPNETVANAIVESIVASIISEEAAPCPDGDKA